MSDTPDRQAAPAFQFYQGDWLRNRGLRLKSLAHRGLAIEMLSHMAGSNEFGVLLVGGRPMSDAELAKLAGEKPAVVARLVRELLEVGVFARRDDGAVFSPRMIRDERVRRARAAGGRLSMEHPSVPKPKEHGKDRRKDGSEDGRKDTLLAPSLGSSGGSPSSSSSLSSSTSASAVTPGPMQRGRFYLHRWQVEELISALGPHADGFDLDVWLDALTQKANAERLTFPTKDGRWNWIQEQFRAEIARRKLPTAVVEVKPDGPRSTVPSVAATAHYLERLENGYLAP